jgi:predicted membrane protein
MKMGGNLFWGSLLIIIGITIIIKIIFHIDIPIFRIIFAFVFIFIGIRILTGSFKSKSFHKNSNDVYFGENNFAYNKSVPKEQNIVFGRGTIDLRNIDSTSLPADMEINTVFGSSEILIPQYMQVRIKVDAAFSGATLPNNNTSAFGTIYYESPNFDRNKPYLNLKINVVFGNLQIRTI